MALTYGWPKAVAVLPAGLVQHESIILQTLRLLQVNTHSEKSVCAFLFFNPGLELTDHM